MPDAESLTKILIQLDSVKSEIRHGMTAIAKTGQDDDITQMLSDYVHRLFHKKSALENQIKEARWGLLC